MNPRCCNQKILLTMKARDKNIQRVTSNKTTYNFHKIKCGLKLVTRSETKRKTLNSKKNLIIEMRSDEN